jgi:hypothetical protein
MDPDESEASYLYEQWQADHELVCVNGHDRCYGIPDPNCPYCERRPPKPDMGTT